MKSKLLVLFCLALLIFPACSSPANVPSSATSTRSPLQVIDLPEPRLTSQVSLEQTLFQRRSVREYYTNPLSLAEVSQLLWSAQGITSSAGGRTAPSAGGLYPLEVYIVAGNVNGLAPGAYHYQPANHQIAFLENGDLRKELSHAGLNQAAIQNGAVDIVITAIYDRVTPRYGDRSVRYSCLEAGHAAQNICLQVIALQLGAVTIGAFEDDQVTEVLHLAPNETPLYILPVGKIF